MKFNPLHLLHADPDLLKAAEGVLKEGETLPAFTEASVQQAVQRRRTHAEFIARGLASREEALRTGGAIAADVVHAQLADRLAQARVKLQSQERG